MKLRRVQTLALTLLFLGSCSMRTATTNTTVLGVKFSMVSAGNMPLTEWQIIPPEYEDYRGSYIKSYSYRFYHDGSVEFTATYGFSSDAGNQPFSEKETGIYRADNMGPGQRINVTLPTRATILTWEPNPRDPTGDLVFRIWENRLMDFGYVDDNHPARQNVNGYVVLRSESISPGPI